MLLTVLWKVIGLPAVKRIMPIKKGQKLSEAHKASISRGLKIAVANGWKPNTERWALGLEKMQGAESRRKAAVTFSKKMRGVPQPIDKSVGKKTENKAAKWWSFKNVAMGYILDGKNLNQLVRDNEYMFDKKYLNWDVCGCTAVRCLRGLTVRRSKKARPRGMWNGWTIK